MLFIFNIQADKIADEIADEIAVIQHRAAGSNTTSSLFYFTPTSLYPPRAPALSTSPLSSLFYDLGLGRVRHSPSLISSEEIYRNRQ